MDDKNNTQNKQKEQDRAAFEPSHIPQNSYGSKSPVKLASGARPVLAVIFITITVATLVILAWVFLSNR